MELRTLNVVSAQLGNNTTYFKARSFRRVVSMIIKHRIEKELHYDKVFYNVEKNYVEALVFWIGK